MIFKFTDFEKIKHHKGLNSQKNTDLFLHLFSEL